MRERLAEIYHKIEIEFLDYMINLAQRAIDGDIEEKIQKRQGFYVDKLLEYGVIVPPCRVGDKVYRISTKINTKVKYIQETTISRIAIDNEGIWLFCTCNPIAKCVFGKTVFLTREEAEAALVNYESSKGGAE